MREQRWPKRNERVHETTCMRALHQQSIKLNQSLNHVQYIESQDSEVALVHGTVI